MNGKSDHLRPKFILKVWRLDQFGKVDCISYGSAVLPNEAGSFEFESPTWRPMGSLMDEAHAFYLGGPPKFVTLNPLTRQLTLRENISTISSGTLHIQCDVILKNFESSGIK